MSEQEEKSVRANISSKSAAHFTSASEFVDAEIDLVDYISDLSVEALVALSVLQVVSNPAEVRVSVTKASRLVVIEFDVCESDIGQVIGRGGHTIDAIRSLAKSALGESDVEYLISVLEDGKPIIRTGGRNRSGRGRGFHRNNRGRG
jgi:predicted RNA-binding protein YlqC (UPF0109 family)